MPLVNLLRIPVPMVLINIVILISPLFVTFLGNSMQTKDYISSFSFLRSLNLISSCCDTFDFIVVGGGSAGSVIASRLSENPNVRVLLIEAGGNPNPLSYIPAAIPLLLNHPSTDWNYRTVRQNGSALGLENNEVIWPRGKGLGGSSNSNFMIYMNGNSRDFDRWADHTGDSRWKYKNLERYFRKVEDYYGTWDGHEYHGKGGPYRVEPVRYHPGLNYVLEAAREMGYKIRDPNNNQKQGFAPIDFNMKRGVRFSSYLAYLFPALTRPNLTIYKYTLAVKIHFNKFKKAEGVSYIRHGVKGYAAARKEIIVCGGSINTPQLLLLSGIGPKRHLREIGIEPIVDLPVGENLQDHVTTAIGPFILNASESFLLERDTTFGSILSYLTNGNGLLSSPGLLTTVGLLSTSMQSPDWPDLMVLANSLGISSTVVRLLGQMFGAGDLLSDYLEPHIGKDSHLMLLMLGLPKSRGFIRLRDRNPYSKPIIDPRYFSDANGEDMKRLVEGAQMLIKLYENTTAFQKLNAHLPEQKAPGCERFQLRTPEYLECQIRLVTLTLYHPTSTCSMGKPGNPDSVVDSQLRVIGVTGLRIADASIMPFVPNANINSPTIVISEMASEMIKRAWNIF